MCFFQDMTSNVGLHVFSKIKDRTGHTEIGL